jgi:pimeloyl-ACP methyl ester carboxylesterase
MVIAAPRAGAGKFRPAFSVSIAMSQTLFFAHANGFPSATYGKLFAGLQPEYRVHHLEQHAHDPRFPVDDNWENLVAELLYHLETLDEPVWGVGHSLGGVLHYHAALRRPELYRGLVLLDSPLLTLPDRLLVQAAKRFGFIDRLTPAGRTEGRRERFADLDEARVYFSGKPLFRRFDPDCLEDYVRHGLAPVEQGLRLKFDPATEVGIYRSLPHRTPGAARQLAVPLAMIRGHSSRTVPFHQARMVRRMPRGECLSMPGGHMFPLERPQETAAVLRTLFQRWTDQGDAP